MNRINLDELSEIKVLGRGTFGKVTLVKDKNGKKFVVKEISEIGRVGVENIEREIAVNKLVSEYPNCHPNITCLYDYFIDRKKDKAILVYVYLEGYYDLYILLRKMVENNKINFELFNKLFRNVVDAIKYLHNHNIIHRDIKEINILTNDNGDVQIIDFGISSIYPNNMYEDIACTPGYCDPYEWNQNNCFISDSFAVGIMFVKYLTNTPNLTDYFSFHDECDENYKVMCNKIDNINFPSQYEYYKSLLKHMINPFGIRPSLNEVSQYLNNKTTLKMTDYKKCLEQYPSRAASMKRREEEQRKRIEQIKKDYLERMKEKASRKVSRKVSRKTSRNASRKSPKKASRKSPKKASRKVSRKASRKSPKKASRKTSRKTSRKVSRKASRKSPKKASRKSPKKASRKSPKKASTKVSRKASRKSSRKSPRKALRKN
jgi:serine/threonine protein kinase